jgi:3-phosphoshikimate 1-carboxyvinyltransferase
VAQTYLDKLAIEPLQAPPHVTVRVPGSKSITNRALVLAALYSLEHSFRLSGVLRSEDTEVMVSALQRLRYPIQPDWTADPPTVTVTPFPWADMPQSAWPPQPADLFVANSGTTMRFLTAVVCLGEGQFRIDGTARMRERPIEDLLGALRQAGVPAHSESANGCPPVIVEGKRRWQADRIRVRGNISSQFLSALLMVAPIACPENGITIEVDGPLVSQPYVDMTLAMLEKGWGLPIARERSQFRVANAGAWGWMPDPRSYAVEADASAASYFFAAAAIAKGTVKVPGLSANGLQGDVRFVDMLGRMGCQVKWETASITVHGRPLHGINVDMNAISDTVMTLAAVACFAEGPTTIRNVAHIRHKETDRLSALATELRRVGAGVDEFADGLTITPRPLHGAEIETYNDHRMAMSMALIGLKVPGIVIKDPGCVAKTYPDFFRDLEGLRRQS